ncbi:MAG: hypothetical protein ACJ74Q_19530 [Pyrinomonadaceae bacterium]
MYMSHTVPGFKLENSFSELGALDFESGLSAAGDLSDKYQRALAVLGLASKCLEDSTAKPGKTKQNRERERPGSSFEIQTFLVAVTRSPPLPVLTAPERCLDTLRARLLNFRVS